MRRIHSRLHPARISFPPVSASGTAPMRLPIMLPRSNAAPHAYTPNVRLRLEMGRNILAEDYVRAAGRVPPSTGGGSCTRRAGWIGPAVPVNRGAANRRRARSQSEGPREPVRAAMLRCTQLFNLTGHPAISVPCGTTSQGLPCGLQLVGRRFETDALMRVALAVEARLR